MKYLTLCDKLWIFLAALSLQPYLVRLNRTCLRFPPVVRLVCTGVKAAVVLRCRPEVKCKGWCRYVFKWNLVWCVCGENMIWTQSVLTAESTACFCTNPAPVDSCVHYRMRKHFPSQQQQHASIRKADKQISCILSKQPLSVNCSSPFPSSVCASMLRCTHNPLTDTK